MAVCWLVCLAPYLVPPLWAASPDESPSAAVATNEISIVTAPARVVAGKKATVVVRYKTGKAGGTFPLQARLMNRGHKEVAQATVYPTSSSGEQPLLVTVPGALSGKGYYWHVQVFNNKKWSVQLAQDKQLGVRITRDSEPEADGSSVRFVAAPSTVRANSNAQVKVRFNTNKAVDNFPLQVRLMNRNDKEVAQKTEYLSTQSGTQSFAVPIPADLATGSGYEWHVQLLGTNWSPTLAQATGSKVTVEGGGPSTPPTDPTNFGECTAEDQSDSVTKCWSSESGYMNNFELRRPMGDGYWSNWWALGGWKGPVKARFGNAGDPTWIEWDNQNEQGNHYEFDLRIHKHSYYLEEGQPDYVGQDRGFPTRVSQIGSPLITTAEGQWTAGSEGRCHLSMTAWIYDGDDPNADVPRADIIIQTWDNSGELWAKYEREQVDTGSDGIKRYNNIVGSIESGDHTFIVLRILPGWKGESASYNLVDTTETRPNPNTPFTTDAIQMKVDVRDVINKLIALEQSPRSGLKPSPIASNWFLHGMEWNLAGQSGIYVTENIKSSRGRFTFTDYTIPDIERGTNPGARGATTATRKPDVAPTLTDDSPVSVFPNPFTDKIKYEYQLDKAALTTVALYSLSGQQLRIVEPAAHQRAGRHRGSVDTRGLGTGTYLLRVSSPEGYEFERVIKK